MRILQTILKVTFSIIWMVLVFAVKLLGLLIQILFSMAVLAFKFVFVMMHAASFD